ncbi:MAG TPA: hypothetical protein VMX16_06930 [Terriglobia bacterium]|nr:hypothetical protein [Terriglobia bacterium]
MENFATNGLLVVETVPGGIMVTVELAEEEELAVLVAVTMSTIGGALVAACNKPLVLIVAI